MNKYTMTKPAADRVLKRLQDSRGNWTYTSIRRALWEEGFTGLTPVSDWLGFLPHEELRIAAQAVARHAENLEGIKENMKRAFEQMFDTEFPA